MRSSLLLLAAAVGALGSSTIYVGNSNYQGITVAAPNMVDCSPEPVNDQHWAWGDRFKIDMLDPGTVKAQVALTRTDITTSTNCPSTSIVNPPDSARLASSIWDNNPMGTSHGTGMLNSGQGWSSKYNSVGQWYQIDVGLAKPVKGIVMQSRSRAWNQYVTAYYVQYSNDGTTWTSYANGAQQNTGITGESNSYFTWTWTSPVTTRFIRIYPTRWVNHMSLRAGVLVCNNGGWGQGLSVECFPTMPSYQMVKQYATCTQWNPTWSPSLGTLSTAASKTSDCAAKCKAQTGCKYFYRGVSGNAQNDCVWAKIPVTDVNFCPNYASNTAYNMYEIYPARYQNAVLIKEDVAYGTTTKIGSYNNNFQGCRAKCESTKGCKYFTWQAAAPGDCYMTSAQNLIAPVYTAQIGYDFFELTDEAEMESQNVKCTTIRNLNKQPSVTNCALACKQVAGCQWFTYGKGPQQGQCYQISATEAASCSSDTLGVADVDYFDLFQTTQHCVGSWLQWGQCSNECDGGVQSRNFKIYTNSARGGKPCDAPDNQLQTQSCNPEPCPGLSGATVHLRIGSSGTVIKSQPCAGCLSCDPEPVNDQYYAWTDRFKVWVTNPGTPSGQASAQRVDATGGWGQDLYLMCYKYVVPYQLIRAGARCKSGDSYLGTFNTAALCATTCIKTTGCKNFIYNSMDQNTGENKCYWEKPNTADGKYCGEGWDTTQLGWNFYEVIPRLAVGAVPIRENVQCGNNNLLLGVASNATGCAQLCKKKADCKYFIYGKGTADNQCLMEVGMTKSDCSWVGNQPYDLYEMTDEAELVEQSVKCPGTSLGTAVQSVDACALLCKAKPGCAYFTFGRGSDFGKCTYISSGQATTCVNNMIDADGDFFDLFATSTHCVGAWKTTTPCTVSCGTGYTIDTYTVTTLPQRGGMYCAEPNGLTRKTTCNTAPCPMFCSNYDCRDNVTMHVDPARRKIQCPKDGDPRSCTDQMCCVPSPKCSTYDCKSNDGYIPDTDRYQKSCSGVLGGVCSADWCCKQGYMSCFNEVENAGIYGHNIEPCRGGGECPADVVSLQWCQALCDSNPDCQSIEWGPEIECTLQNVTNATLPADRKKDWWQGKPGFREDWPSDYYEPTGCVPNLDGGCVFQIGDGTGGTETYLGMTKSAAQCLALVEEKQKFSNGATWGVVGGSAAGKCFAENGMTGANTNRNYATCVFKAKDVSIKFAVVYGYGTPNVLWYPDVEAARKKLNDLGFYKYQYSGNFIMAAIYRSLYITPRLIVQFVNGVSGDPHYVKSKTTGKEQSGGYQNGLGFDKYWNDWSAINYMKKQAESKFASSPNFAPSK
eukprot:NODE_22_length_4339_cov_431.329934_g20_i0.p1 GENE.NODE_22_length_4339_cov_431.329934_g20_i0~~NODE_22_length_4339_cov_431.329934_g20_i0.p1  ORF type:complete len:1325 (+),score=331.29 NODE_22_length_4339_cov_431.329934_g20_i0:54-4028(+)